MKTYVSRISALLLLTALAACSGGQSNAAANQANVAAEEGTDLNMAISGDELSPTPEAQGDMIANDSGTGNAVGNTAAAQPPTLQPPTRPPVPGNSAPPQGR